MHRLAVIAIATICSVSHGQTVLTMGFEVDEVPDGTADFTIGDAPATVSFLNGFTEIATEADNVASGASSYLFLGGSGSIEFGAPATSVSFRHHTGDFITFFDSNGEQIAEFTSDVAWFDEDDPLSTFALEAPDIRRIEFSILASSTRPFQSYLDDFEAIVTPAPGHVTTISLGCLLLSRRRR